MIVKEEEEEEKEKNLKMQHNEKYPQELIPPKLIYVIVSPRKFPNFTKDRLKGIRFLRFMAYEQLNDLFGDKIENPKSFSND